MNREKGDADYPVELESQFLLRLPEEPAKALRDVLSTGENFKNRLSIQIENDMRHGEVRFDHWLLHGKIVDLPTIIESLKTIDRKSVYKTADICQMMICKYEPEQPTIEEESPAKNKKKDPNKVDKKFLFPHGVTPPTKNVRKRRFRKTLKKKSAEAPEIEKEVKRLLRADNEAVSYTWEIIQEDEPTPVTKPEKGKLKKEKEVKPEATTSTKPSNVEDIFGGTLSDSDLEDENVNMDMDDSRMSAYDEHISDVSVPGPSETRTNRYDTQFNPDMFLAPREKYISKPSTSTSSVKNENLMVDSFLNLPTNDSQYAKLQQLNLELEELKQRRQKTQHEISRMENMTLRQRFEEILQSINKDIRFKEMEYQNLQSQLK